MRNFVILLVAMAMVACSSNGWKPGDPVKSGHDYLCSAGIWDDSLCVANDINYNDDGAALPHLILDEPHYQALGLDKIMYLDTVTSVARVWGVKEYPDGVALLLGQTSYSDTRTCWLATYGKGGIIDFMRLGECGGMNLSYWDDIDEHTRLVGIDSMRMVMPDKPGTSINISRWISYNQMRDGVETDSTLWFIHHELPVTIDKEGHINVGKVGIVYSADTTLLTPYWRSKRQLEVFSWTPLSDTTLYDRIETYLNQTRGAITDPKQLLGDFHMLVFNRLHCDGDHLMQWCCDHPDSQLTRGMVNIFKDVNPEFILGEIKRIKQPIQNRARQLLGL